ncbi:DNA polymerase III subunit delta [Mycoplasma simbae]|uniref:DNA polymerase III subunit delta n=1 Tax=Mycoplasma simbae TaxID=36744 RepID=UPI0004957DED|nr:hypothetical protein [Mycoplasma simbae]
MYIIYGPEKYFINQYTQQIINSQPNCEVINFDCNEASLIELENLIASNSIFDSGRIIFIHDCTYLENKIAKTDTNNAQIILDALQANTLDTIVFVNTNILSKESIASNFFTNKLMQYNPTLLFANSLSGIELNRKIQQIAQQYGAKIDNLAINTLNQKLPNDLYLIELEIAKLANLDSNISSQLVQQNVTDAYIEDTFGFARSIESGDFGLIWRKYKQKVAEGIEINALIGQLAQQLVLANQIHTFFKLNLSLEDVATSLKLNQYRVKKVYSLLRNFGIKKINSMLQELADLDKDLSNFQVDAQIGFEQFLLNNFN